MENEQAQPSDRFSENRLIFTKIAEETARLAAELGTLAGRMLGIEREVERLARPRMRVMVAKDRYGIPITYICSRDSDEEKELLAELDGKVAQG